MKSCIQPLCNFAYSEGAEVSYMDLAFNLPIGLLIVANCYCVLGTLLDN